MTRGAGSFRGTQSAICRRESLPEVGVEPTRGLSPTGF